MVYTHVLNRGGRGVASPLDQPAGHEPPGGVEEPRAWYRVGEARPAGVPA